MFKDILKTMKINHYIKNLVVLIPLLFSMQIFNYHLYLDCIIIFIAFCLISSSVYVMNDLVDIEKDKLHPIKCQRAIAAGRISKNFACCLFILLFIVSFILGYFLNIYCFLFILLYLILNILYSFWLKNIAIIDAACIALGFILRIVAGCFAINVLPSPLVILMTLFISMFFTFTKRKLELEVTSNQQCRQSIKQFDINTVNQFININATLSIAFYFTYVLDSTTMLRAGTQYLYLTVLPFTLIIYRLLLLGNIDIKSDDPIYYIQHDKILCVLFVFYVILFLFLILI